MKFEDITDETLKLMLKGAEHDFVERKSKSDKGDWLETAVAFANSAPIGYPAVLFVGADDDGNPQLQEAELERTMKSISDVLARAFPAIYRHIVPVQLADGHCLAVIVPGSSSRPHFAGPSFVRVGPQTKRASEAQFENLIAQRNSKARKILEYLGKRIKLRSANSTSIFGESWKVADCSQFFVLLTEGPELVPGRGTTRTVAFPLERIDISFDPNDKTLELISI